MRNQTFVILKYFYPYTIDYRGVYAFYGLYLLNNINLGVMVMNKIIILLIILILI